jgi:hypothetical protein
MDVAACCQCSPSLHCKAAQCCAVAGCSYRVHGKLCRTNSCHWGGGGRASCPFCTRQLQQQLEGYIKGVLMAGLGNTERQQQHTRSPYQRQHINIVSHIAFSQSLACVESLYQQQQQQPAIAIYSAAWHSTAQHTPALVQITSAAIQHNVRCGPQHTATLLCCHMASSTQPMRPLCC